MDGPGQSSDYPVFASPPSNLSIHDQEEIDRGAYGSVYPGELAGNPVAIKRIHPVLLAAESEQGRRVRQDFQAECQRMKDIGDHPNVVGFLGAYQDRKGPFLVMEKMSQNLQNLLEASEGTLSLQQQMRLCLDIATGLEFLHSQNPPIVHRDLSAKNVLLDETGRAKIGDLGQSKLKTASFFKTRQPGAIPYMPPEALRDNPHYDEKVDVFSFGVLMLEIATQSQPSSSLEGINFIPEEDRRHSDLVLLAEDHPLKPLIRMCLKDNAAERPDAAMLLKKLQEMHQQLPQPPPLAPVVFTQAKECFISAIEPLKDNYWEVMQLAERTKSLESEDLRVLSIGSVDKILKLIQRSEMKVVFFGRTSNGKSTVINALLKSKVLPFGAGSTTTAICYIRGRDTPSGSGTVKFGGDSREVPVESDEDLANHMEEDHHGDVQVYWSTAQCPMLKGDIVLVDCPGLNAESEMDDKVLKFCSDADVFVYVANGFTTFETAERNLLASVKETISIPSNTFILFNHWDRVEEDGAKIASKVKHQQLSKVTRIMVQDLNIFTEEMVHERTFFVSAKQAINNAVGCAASGQQAGSHLLQEFSRFEDVLQECLTEAAIRTKFGRHYKECQPIVACIGTAVTCMRHRWKEEHDPSKAERSKKELLIQENDKKLQRFHWMRHQTMEEALEKIDVMCENFYSYIKERLLEEVYNYPPLGGLAQDCEELTMLLRKKIVEKEERLTKQWIDVATGVVLSLSEPLEPVGKMVIRAGTAKASPQLSSQTVISTQLPLIRIGPSRAVASVILGTGAGLLAGAVAGLLGGSGAGRLAFATVGAAVGGWSYGATGPDKLGEEDEAKKEIRKQVLEYLLQYKEEIKRRYRDRLQEHVQSSTNATCQRVKQQSRRHKVAVDDLTRRLWILGPWLLEACHLEDKVKEMELQLSQFEGTYLHSRLD